MWEKNDWGWFCNCWSNGPALARQFDSIEHVRTLALSEEGFVNHLKELSVPEARRLWYGLKGAGILNDEVYH